MGKKDAMIMCLNLLIFLKNTNTKELSMLIKICINLYKEMLTYSFKIAKFASRLYVFSMACKKIFKSNMCSDEIM